jgi:isopropylmalate/homocitrate/citramalate synthase
VKLEHREVESTANVLTAAFDDRIDHPIELYDNTLREGEQPPGVAFSSDEKLQIARALDEFGVDWANVGFPAVSMEEQRAILRITRAGLKMKTAALSRLMPSDIDATVDSGVQMVSLFLPGSDVHLKDKLRLSEKEALDKIGDACRRVKGHGVRVAFTVEDGSRTPLRRLIRMFDLAAEAGADYLILADTVGVLTPPSAQRIVRLLRAFFPVPIGLHFHDDLGLALANSLAGLSGGAQMAHVTVNGVGERSGNTCLEELAVVLKVKYGRDLGFRLDTIDELSRRVHRASGTAASEHKSITGKWCFSHESGVHVAGILANPETYQAFPPRAVGRHHEILFGKHSGANGLAHLADTAGLTVSESGRRAVLEKIKSYAEGKRGPLAEDQILAWLREEGAR